MDSLKKIVWKIAQIVAQLLAIVFTFGRFGLILGEVISKLMKKKNTRTGSPKYRAKIFCAR